MRPRSLVFNQRSSADGVKNAGETGADAAEDEREVRPAAAVTGSPPYDTQRHIVRTQFPAEGTRWGEAWELVASEERAERTHNMCCVTVEGSKANAQARSDEGASTVALGRSFMPSAERSGFDFSAGADPLDCINSIRGTRASAARFILPVSDGFRLRNGMQ